MSDETLFDLPNSPEELGVVLPSANLRRIDFSALEFTTIRRALVEYVKTYYSDTFNDFVTSNGAVMFMEIVAWVGAVLSTREDILADEAFLPSAQTRAAVEQHLALINRPLKRQTPAVVDVAVRVNNPAPTSIKIAAGTQFVLRGADGNPLIYEIFRAPNDFTNPIEILPGKLGTVAFGIEGQTPTPRTALSSGGADQSIQISESDILDNPISVEVTTGSSSVKWLRVDALEKAGANDEVYVISFNDDGAAVKFGNDVNGKAPLAGQSISVSYRVGGGIRGRISSNVINTTLSIQPELPASAPVEVLFRNLDPSSGGENRESIEVAKRVAPKEAATLYSATTGEDYAVLAKNFRSPIYGSVLKAVASLRTSLNANLVELYVLAEGSDDDPVVTPSKGLKTGIQSYFNDIQVLTDEIRVYDGIIKPVNVEVVVVADRNSDPNVVRESALSTINEFFNINKRDMGESFFRSKLIAALNDIDGVQWVDLISPSSNIVAVDGESTSDNTVGFNELIVLSQTNLKLFFEPN